MNILVVSENYLEGGLEQHIMEFAQQGELHNDRTYFAFANCKNPLPEIIQDSLIGILHCDRKESSSSIQHDVTVLVEAVRKYRIDIIQVHPFRTYLPSVIASQLTQTPLVFTMHSHISFTFPTSQNQTLLFQHFLSNAVSSIFTVNRSYVKTLASYFPDTDVNYLPNPVTPGSCSPSNNHLAGHWSLVSRIDRDKIGGIKHFIDWLPELPIKCLDIFGNGACVQDLKTYIEDHDIPQEINWHGYSDNWIEYASACEGVIGLDRVAVEAASSGLPVILLTYNSNPCGLLTMERYPECRSCNFNGNPLQQLDSVTALAREMNELLPGKEEFEQIRQQVLSDYSSERVYENYARVLRNSKFRPSPEYIDFYETIIREIDSNTGSPSPTNRITSATMARYFTNPLVFNAYIASAGTEAIRYLQNETKKDLEALRAEHSSFTQELFASLESALEKERSASEEQFAQTEKQLDDIARKLSESSIILKKNSKRILLLESELAKRDHRISELLNSNSWKIGRVFTYFPRKLKRLLKR